MGGKTVFEQELHSDNTMPSVPGHGAQPKQVLTSWISNTDVQRIHKEIHSEEL